jgi:hypothetical protein
VSGSYGVVWQESDRLPCAGKLELDLEELRLEGSVSGNAASYALPYRDLTSVHIGREERERLEGLPTLLLERVGGGTIRVAALAAQAGIVAEIAERLVTETAESPPPAEA